MAEQTNTEYTVVEKNGKKALISLEVFRGKFRAFMAWWVITIAFVYLFMASFMKYPKNEYVGTIIGFLTGTAVAMVLAFYFSGSQQVDEQTQQAQINKLKQRLSEKDEEIEAARNSTFTISSPQE